MQKPVKYSAPALSKGLDILELLASEPMGLRKSDIARALDRSVSEIFRMLVVLEERGYVAQAAGDEYTLTTKLFEVAHRHPPIRRLSLVAGNVMREAAQSTNQSLHLAILHGAQILIIAQVDAPGNHVHSVRLGARLPIVETASGAVLVHAMPEAEREALIAECDEDKELLEEFRRNVDGCIKSGICESRSVVIAGMRNISVPIFDFSGAVTAALTVPYVTRLRSTRAPISFEDSRKVLMDAGREISRLLGAASAASSGPFQDC